MNKIEFKNKLKEKGFYYFENSYYGGVISLSSLDNTNLAVVSLECRADFYIKHPSILGDDVIDLVVEFAKTPIEERNLTPDQRIDDGIDYKEKYEKLNRRVLKIERDLSSLPYPIYYTDRRPMPLRYETHDFSAWAEAISNDLKKLKIQKPKWFK